jgi:hypothetical protein
MSNARICIATGRYPRAGETFVNRHIAQLSGGGCPTGLRHPGTQAMPGRTDIDRVQPGPPVGYGSSAASLTRKLRD